MMKMICTFIVLFRLGYDCYAQLPVTAKYGAVRSNAQDYDTKQKKADSTIKADTSTFAKRVITIPYVQLMPLYQKLVKDPFGKKDVKPAILFFYSNKLVARFNSFRESRPKEYLDMQPEKWLETFNTSFSKEILVTHIQLLSLFAKDQEALQYAQIAEKYLNYENPQVNSTYALLLDQNGATREDLKKVLLASIHRNQATPEMIGLIGKIYLEEHRPEKEFSSYLHSLKDSAGWNPLPARVMEAMVNKDMPTWNVQDYKGKLIDQKVLTGKTVVLYFWSAKTAATKPFLSEMNKTFNRYENDPAVKFYFVNLEEASELNMRLFATISTSFSQAELPLLLVINPKGRLNFITVVKKGEPGELTGDVTVMIDFVKAGDKPG